MARAFVFPGQGSQHVGMGSALAEAFPAARHVFGEVDDALDRRLSRLMFDGPEDELKLTENAQPALVAMSLAVVRVVESEGGVMLAENAEFVAGHSVGEYAALAAAGAIGVKRYWAQVDILVEGSASPASTRRLLFCPGMIRVAVNTRLHASRQKAPAISFNTPLVVGWLS